MAAGTHVSLRVGQQRLRRQVGQPRLTFRLSRQVLPHPASEASALGSSVSAGLAHGAVLRLAAASGASTSTGLGAAVRIFVAAAAAASSSVGSAIAAVVRRALAIGSSTSTGSATGQVSGDVSASGASISVGSARALVQRVAAALGASVSGGAGSAAAARAASASGSSVSEGTAVGQTDTTLLGEALGESVSTGAAVAAVARLASAAGASTSVGAASAGAARPAAATGASSSAGAAVGAAERTGSAAGASTSDGDAAGAAARLAAAVGASTSAGSASAIKVRAAEASGSSSSAGSAVAAAERAGVAAGASTSAGSAVGAAERTTAAAGASSSAGTASAARLREAAASGASTSAGSAIGAAERFASASGSSASDGDATGAAERSANASGASTSDGDAVGTVVSGASDPVDLSGLGTPTFFTTTPTGGGNPQYTILKATRTQAEGTSNFDPWSYDTYVGGGARTVDWFGYTFADDVTFSRVIFQEGMGEGGGGFFASGTIKIQVRIGGVWTDVTGTSVSPTYDPDGSPTYQTYTFDFDPTTGDGVRVYGDPGGGENWTSVASIEAVGIHELGIEPLLTGRTAHAKVPTGGSVGTLARIIDGVRPAPTHGGTEYTYNSNNGVGKAEDYWGITFDADYEFHYLLFQHGPTGGNVLGSVKVQVLISGVWTDVTSLTSSPTYPTSTPYVPHQIYLFGFTPVTGNGIRVYGTVAGTTWTNCAEVLAYGKAA